jgi:hypothetical protein
MSDKPRLRDTEAMHKMAGRAERRRMQKPHGRKRIRGVMAVPPLGRPWRKPVHSENPPDNGALQ